MNNPWCDLLGIASADVDAMMANRPVKKGAKPKPAPDEIAAYKKKMRSQFPQLSEKVINDIYDTAVSRHPDMYQAVEAIKHEIGQGVGQAAFDQKPGWRRAVRIIGNVMNAPRSMMTPLDIPMMRQAGIITVSHPIMAFRTVKKILGEKAWDEETAKAIDASIRARDNFDALQENGMYHSPMERNARPEAKEEQYSNTLAERIPGWGKVIRGSELVYSTALNLMRADLADRKIADFVKDHGRQPNKTEMAVLAKYVNVVSGRGSLGALEKIAPELNQLFFSPRWVASRLQFLTRGLTDTAPGTVRALARDTRLSKHMPMKEGDLMRLQIGREYGRYVLGVSALLGSLKLAKELAPGTDEEKDKQLEIFGGGDMKDTDWGKFRIGSTHFDLMSGLGQQMVLADRLITGSTYQSGKLVRLGERVPGTPTKAPTRLDLIGHFGRSKLGPFPGLIASIGANEKVPKYKEAPAWMGPQLGVDVTGNPVTPVSAVVGLATPMIGHDVYEALRLDGVPTAVAVAVLSALSTSTSTYQSKPKIKKPK